MSGPVRLVLLGDPVEHSRSPAIHTAALRHLGLVGTYQARRADVAGLEEALAELRSGALHGANVTMPLKRAAAERADELTAEAAAAGSVNTLRFRRGRVEGHSTDLVAIGAALAEERFPNEAPLLVLGSGGAASASVVAAGDRLVHLSARDQERARRVIGLGANPGSVLPWGAPVHGALVINATPIGMKGESLPHHVLREAAGLIDLAYGAGETGSIAWARGHRVPHLDGVEFLVRQAAVSFEWWTGRPAPFEVMHGAARNA